MTIYSHSRLEAFKKCPLKYKFNYIDKIKRKEEGIEAFLGSRFHGVMKNIYKDLPFRKYSLDELLDFYEDDWNKNYHDKIIIAKKERKAKDYKEIGKKFIEDYYKHYYPFNQGKVLGYFVSVSKNIKKYFERKTSQGCLMIEKENGPDEYIDYLRQDIFERFNELLEFL